MSPFPGQPCLMSLYVLAHERTLYFSMTFHHFGGKSLGILLAGLISVCLCNFQSGQLILTADERFAFCGMASLFLLSRSLLRIVGCDTFTPALWGSLVMLLFVGFLFTALTKFLLSTTVRCLVFQCTSGFFLFKPFRHVI